MPKIGTLLFRVMIIGATLGLGFPALAQFYFGDWTLTHDKTQCAARKQTRAGTLLVFTHQPDTGISIVLVNPTWTMRFKKGQSYSVALKFDQNSVVSDSEAGSIQIPGRGIGFNALTKNSANFMRLLANSDELRVFVDGQFLEEFSLEGSDEISRSLTVCDRS